jgi:dihydroneopterin aldolase/2-amino-4-hydroxy-6-hydroxymethyldihydropteridine diphosphokinase
MGPPQPDYLNGVIELSTSLQPAALLAELNRIEAALGRERLIHWGPRTVDLDILFWGDLILDTETLTIPHPGACERLFVLEPLAELAPDLADPRSGKTVSEILASLRS